MHIIIPRFSSLDPNAGEAVQAISAFDAMVEDHASVESILVLAAATTGVAVRLFDSVHGLDIRVDPGGRISRPTTDEPRTEWLCAPVSAEPVATVWLERAVDDMTLVDGLVLDRTVVAVRATVRDCRRPPTGSDLVAATVTLVDAAATGAERDAAIRALRLDSDRRARVVVTVGGPMRIEAEPVDDHQPDPDTRISGGPALRTGVGVFTSIDRLPSSFSSARLALAFAADGSDHDPGPSIVDAADLGELRILADGLDACSAPPVDVTTLDAAAMSGQWALRSLVALVSHSSARLAAAALFVHHSTFQERIATLEDQLGWPIREPSGQFRLQLALACRRYLLHPRD